MKTLAIGHVVSHVTLEIARLRESFSTRVAFERFLAGVSAHVRLQVDQLSEPLVAVAARVRLHVLVHHHVPLESKRVGRREFLAAD